MTEATEDILVFMKCMGQICERKDLTFSIQDCCSCVTCSFTGCPDIADGQLFWTEYIVLETEYLSTHMNSDWQ